MANALYDFAHDIYHSRTRGRLVVIHGQNGCGKTRAARLILKWFNQIRLTLGPVTVKTDEGQDAMLPDACYRMWPAVVDGFKRDQWLILDSLEQSYLTIIDDIGAEHDPSGIGMEKLYLILSRREFMHTLITTNVPPASWDSRFERRVASRLFRNSTHIDLSEVPDFNG